jgi:integrase
VFNDGALGGRRGGKPGGLAPRTRHHLRALLKAALNRAVEDQVLVRNPLAHGRRKRVVKTESVPMTVLTPEQSMGLLEGLKHTRVNWPALLAPATGMRWGEILALRWDGVDFENQLVRVTESLEETRPTKGKATLPMVSESLTHEFARLVGRIKCLPRVTFQGLRHTHAAHLLKAKEHPKVVHERLGHSTIAITMDLYSHLMDGMETGAAAKIDEAFAAARGEIG